MLKSQMSTLSFCHKHEIMCVHPSVWVNGFGSIKWKPLHDQPSSPNVLHYIIYPVWWGSSHKVATCVFRKNDTKTFKYNKKLQTDFVGDWPWHMVSRDGMVLQRCALLLLLGTKSATKVILFLKSHLCTCTPCEYQDLIHGREKESLVCLIFNWCSLYLRSELLHLHRHVHTHIWCYLFQFLFQTRKFSDKKLVFATLEIPALYKGFFIPRMTKQI